MEEEVDFGKTTHKYLLLFNEALKCYPETSQKDSVLRRINFPRALVRLLCFVLCGQRWSRCGNK